MNPQDLWRAALLDAQTATVLTGCTEPRFAHRLRLWLRNTSDADVGQLRKRLYRIANVGSQKFSFVHALIAQCLG